MKTQEELFIPKIKHKGLKIILATLLIVGLGVGGYYLYQEKFNNPNRIVTNVISDLQKESENSISLTPGNDKYKINGLIKINATLPDELQKISEIIKNFDLQFSGQIDSKNNINNITLNTKYKNEKLIDIKIYNENQDVYFLLDGLYDKYLHASLDDAQNITKTEFDININETKVLFNSFLEATKKAINELELKHASTSIIINEKEYSVNNNYIELKNKELNNFLKQIINTLSHDNKFKTAFKNLTHEDAQDIFYEVLKSLDAQEFKETVKLNFYTNGILTQKLVSIRVEIINEDGKTSLYMDKTNNDEAIITFKGTGINILGKIKKNNSIANLVLNAEIMGVAVKIEMNTNYEKISEVTKENVSNSQDIDKLTEEETKIISDRFQSNDALANILKDIAETNLIQE